MLVAMKRFLLIVLALTATSSFAQVAPPTNRGAAPPPATPPQAPLPPGAKIAYVNVAAIAANSVDGKAANAKMEALANKKKSELAANRRPVATVTVARPRDTSLLDPRGMAAFDSSEPPLRVSGLTWRTMVTSCASVHKY